jgi:hypothetical protein
MQRFCFVLKWRHSARQWQYSKQERGGIGTQSGHKKAAQVKKPRSCYCAHLPESHRYCRLMADMCEHMMGEKVAHVIVGLEG